MMFDRKWTTAEGDAWVYSQLSKQGQKAWRVIFGLPKLLRGNPSADIGHVAEEDNDNPSADCNFKK